jgi:hypothetical protein
MPLIKYNNQSLSSITTLPASIPTGKLKLISSQTASNSASISFTSGLNSTYKVYKFVFVNININGGTSDAQLTFNLSTDGGSNYNVTKTTTMFRAYHNEADDDAGIDYSTGGDLAQSTSYQIISQGLPNDADSNASGSLSLFNPASTTYVKHFISDVNGIRPVGNGSSYRILVAGYGNTTSAVNAIRFQMTSGNIIAGKIYLYAIDNS